MISLAPRLSRQHRGKSANRLECERQVDFTDRRELEGHRCDLGSFEEALRERAGTLKIELLASIDIYTEKQRGRVPSIEMGA